MQIGYPEQHVVGIIENAHEAVASAEDLRQSGFLDSEIDIVCGPEAADQVKKTTGRSGFMDAAMRFANKLGMPNDELMIKRRYERALDDGKFVISVWSPDDQRKEVAANVLKDHQGHFINYLQHFTIEALEP